MTDQTTEVSIEVPIALQQLILANNEILKSFQLKLLEQVQDANMQMMQILRLDPVQGWKLDVERMKYVRPLTEEEKSNAPVV
jgi:hypothetical protein